MLITSVHSALRGIHAMMLVSSDEFQLPDAEQLRSIATEQYKTRGGFNCIGAMDGTHIPVEFGGLNDSDLYKNYKVCRVVSSYAAYERVVADGVTPILI